MPLRFSVLAVSAIFAITACGTGSQSDQPAASPSTVTLTVGPPTPSPAPTGPAVATPVVGSVLAVPMPVAGTDGKTHLAYELLLTNAISQELTLTSVAAVAGDKDLLTLSGDDLANSTRRLGNPSPTATLRPSETARVWLDVALDESAGIPSDISHTVGITVAEPVPPVIQPTMTETIAATVVDNRKPVTVSAPLTGNGWLAVNACCDMNPHRTAANPLNGALWVAERYAIDYLRLTPDGRVFNGDKADLRSYPGFGADVHAVSDGTVVAAVDGLAEQVPGVTPTGLALDQYAGNRVIQDIGGGNFVMYAHLQTGSVKVKAGDRLTTGQPLGNVGNTGNTDAPHLHFQLMNSSDPLRSNGLPFAFERFRLDARVAPIVDEISDVPLPLQDGVTASEQSYRMPLNADVMTYQGR
ncbi:MAG: M23 family metallopeptidase [Candidatus Sericytochromatia bacterium]